MSGDDQERLRCETPDLIDIFGVHIYIHLLDLSDAFELLNISLGCKDQLCKAWVS